MTLLPRRVFQWDLIRHTTSNKHRDGWEGRDGDGGRGTGGGRKLNVEGQMPNVEWLCMRFYLLRASRRYMDNRVWFHLVLLTGRLRVPGSITIRAVDACHVGEGSQRFLLHVGLAHSEPTDAILSRCMYTVCLEEDQKMHEARDGMLQGHTHRSVYYTRMCSMVMSRAPCSSQWMGGEQRREAERPTTVKWRVHLRVRLRK